MLKSSQIEDLLRNIPEGFLKPDNGFFLSSNTNLLRPYKKLGAINSVDIERNFEESPIELSSASSKTIYCNVLNCNLVFDNAASYTTHYNSMHRFICQECRKTLPTEHLLDLHISEKHDSYFLARIERGERLFKCYVEECNHLFLNSAERKEHCVSQHKFPSNFRFDQIAAPKKLAKHKSENTMELDDNQPSKEISLKNFSFGHQREKTFQLKSSSAKTKSDSGEALGNLNSLKDALDCTVDVS